MYAYRLFQAPADAVADNSVAVLLADGIADARRTAILPVQDFQQEQGPAPLFTTARSQEFCPLAKPPGFLLRGLARLRQGIVSSA